jgi:hypothetical protein
VSILKVGKINRSETGQTYFENRQYELGAMAFFQYEAQKSHPGTLGGFATIINGTT